MAAAHAVTILSIPDLLKFMNHDFKAHFNESNFHFDFAMGARCGNMNKSCRISMSMGEQACAD